MSVETVWERYGLTISGNIGNAKTKVKPLFNRQDYWDLGD